jgi:glycosyltransferase involved in cell wall biosynthesis
MKVCVICREHPILHFNGGLSIAAWNTARAAADAGVEVDFVTAAGKSGEMNGINIICLPDGDHADYNKWHPAVAKWWASNKVEYDLLHCHGYSGAPVAMVGTDVPILFHDHGSKGGYVQTIVTDAVMRTGMTEAFWKQLRDFVANVYNATPAPAKEADFKHMRRYDRVIATSHISEMDFRTRYLLTNVELFYHPIYLPDVAVRPERDSARPIVAVFAGDLDNPWKCGELWLKKLLPLKDDIRLLMIGPGKMTCQYAKQNFSDVITTGHLPEHEALGYLSTADVLYEPSTHHIGLNLTGISAIGLGVPVVAFPTAGHTDMIGISGHTAGLVVDPMSPAGVVNGIRKVLKNRDTCSKVARERFCEIFHPKVASARILDIYEDVVRERVFDQ